MVEMSPTRKWILSAGLALAVAGAPLFIAPLSQPAAASEIRYVVNKVPVTSYDIQRRAAFLRLQNRKGNVSAIAEEEMIDQALRSAEMRRLGITISDEQVNDAYARFAKGNNMSTKQLDGVMEQAGIGRAHFKDFIRSQMGWNQAMAGRMRRATGTRVSERDAVKRMLEQGGAKPTATEYMLQQVIFVVPAAERGKMAARKKEAEAMRARFAGCDRTREFARGLLDVTVRDLGRKYAPELPAEWAEQIKAAKVGGATTLRETDRGVEFIGICSSREVSDDRVAQMVFSVEGLGQSGEQKEDDESKKYLAELREKARIDKR